MYPFLDAFYHDPVFFIVASFFAFVACIAILRTLGFSSWGNNNNHHHHCD